MPRLRDLLLRFRPTGGPGAATAGGVPADRAADMSAELRPVFVELADTERQCQEVLGEASRAVARITLDGREQARDIRANAGQRATVARAEAASRLRREADDEIRARSDAVELAAQAVDARVADLLARYVDSVAAATGLS